ncbi:MAG: Xylose isomerase-like TIM barrel [Firmicutes bacterium ADurb.Bin300]|nr:MAG: Xylose isomerase-like TIM barrel [Firmicutes bacterium ADurb.Bin300]
MKIAVQLYSVRDHIKKGEDLLNILGKVKEIGFEGVEFAGYFGLSAEILKTRLDELGLIPVGTHIGLDNYKPKNLAQTIEFGRTIGFKYMGVGGAPHSTEKQCIRTGEKLGNASKEAAQYGITMYYHNHSDEFKPLRNGKLPIDIIKSLTKLQVDTYWSFYAGVDNYKFLTDNKDDIVHIHIKDGINGTPKALGEGNCDLAAVLKAAKDINLEWIVLENDDPSPDGLSDITRSMKWLQANI